MATNKKKDQWDAPIVAGTFLKAEALHNPIDEMKLPEIAESWVTLDYVEKKISPRKEGLRQALFAAAEENGNDDEKGNQTLFIEGTEVVRQKRESSSPDEEGLLALLQEKKIDVLEAFDEVKTLQFNPSKVEHLIKVGKLPKDAVKTLTRVNWALRVVPNSLLKEQLESEFAPEVPEASKKRAARSR